MTRIYSKVWIQPLTNRPVTSQLCGVGKGWSQGRGRKERWCDPDDDSCSSSLLSSMERKDVAGHNRKPDMENGFN